MTIGDTVPTEFDHVRIAKQARIEADGRCIACDLDFPGHAHKMLGVILPPRASFTPEGEETLELISGDCRVRLSEGEWQTLSGGSECHVSAGCRCEIETDQQVHYVRHVETAVEKESGSPQWHACCVQHLHSLHCCGFFVPAACRIAAASASSTAGKRT